jgi:hypothetical protein
VPNRALAFLFVLCAIGSCKRASVATPQQLKKAKGQPTHVVVQHVLIGFESSTRRDTATRNFLEAKALAKKLYRRARAGEDFQALVEEYSDGDKPGVFEMTNYGVSVGFGEVSRKDLVESFGDMAFKLKPGGVTSTEFHLDKSPSGFHVIKRLK